MFNRFSLTTSMLIMTVLVGLVIWACYDAYQYQALNTVLKENLTQRFNAQARVHRLRFDSYVKSFYPSVKLYARNERLHDYLQTVDWSQPPAEIIEHNQVPTWLPELSSMRRFVLPRYAMLIDESGQTREIYNYRNSVASDELQNISPLTREISKGQGYLALFNERPYLITTEGVSTIVNGENFGASLLIASPVDEKFLQESQGASLHEGVIALLKDDEDRILVSDNSELVAPGTPLSELKKSYLFTGEGFFDSGSSDIIVRFCSLISTGEVHNQTAEILKKDRQIRAVTAILSIFSFALVMYWVTTRIRKLSRKVVAFSEEMDMPQPQLRHKDELLELENRFEMLADAVQRETRSLEHQTLHDLLTDLPNRKFLHRRLKHDIASCEIDGCSFVLMICDLNNFKDVNDTLGHHVGDQVLQHASVRFQSVLRNDDTVARMGGDEFCIVLSRTSYKVAAIIASKITEAFAAPFAIEGNIVKVGISIGIVEYPEHGRDVDTLMKHADAAMYDAKSRRSGFTIYDPVPGNNHKAAR